MKKITFTPEQLLFLKKVYNSIGFGPISIRDIIDDNQNSIVDIESELPEEDIDYIVDSIKKYIVKMASEDEVVTANKILEILGVLPEEAVDLSESEHNADDEIDDYPGPDKEGFKQIRFPEEEYKYQVFLGRCISSFFQTLKYLSTSIKNYKL